jgi:penicillin-binding protein 2
MFPDDRTTLTFRLGTIQYVAAALFAALAVCFWYVQVLQHAKFLEMAENNHQRTLPLRAPRGMLFDRNGHVMVENRDALNISLVRENRKTLDHSISLLAQVTGVGEPAVREILNRNKKVPSYRPVVIIQDATLAQVAAVKARRHELPDVFVEQVPTRRYPKDDLAAHLFGYVGEITDQQLVRPEFTGLTSGAVVGQAGLEQTYNSWLMGRDGARYVVVNSVGREMGSESKENPAEGKRLELTIDYDVQRAAQEGFLTAGYNGAAVMLDAQSGEVLSLVSRPAFDPNSFAAGGIDRDTWAQLTGDNLRPLQNRAIQGRYSPGSTFKIAVAVAGLEEGIITPAFHAFCPGGATFYGRYFKCHSGGPHGSIDLRHAIEKSCNVYFYTVGNMVGIDRLHKWASALGLGVETGIDLPHEIEGIMPSSEWKRAKKGEKWYAGETISVSIGQGQVSVTPISMAVMMMTVANGGTRYAPHLVRAIDEGDGWKPVPPPAPKSVVTMKQETVDALHDGLFMVVNGAGTGRRAQVIGYDVAGKTGTAQVISNQGKQRAGKTTKDLRDHGWFVFFAPAKNPEIAGVVFAEHAEHGSNAAPIAKYMIETYFAKKEGRPLPKYPEPSKNLVAVQNDEPAEPRVEDAGSQPAPAPRSTAPVAVTAPVAPRTGGGGR